MNIEEIITGPMSSGKTGTIICRYLNYVGDKVMVSKSGVVESRNGDTVLRDCISHEKFRHLARNNLLFPNVMYFIDEAQFMKGLTDIVFSSTSSFILAMLDMNYMGEYFDEYARLRHMASKITILRADCDHCDNKAMFSALDSSKEETLDKDAYSACCPVCFTIRMDKDPEVNTDVTSNKTYNVLFNHLDKDLESYRYPTKHINVNNNDIPCDFGDNIAPCLITLFWIVLLYVGIINT